MELRRLRPKVKKGDLVLVYVSSPAKELTGAFKVDNVIELPLDELWEAVKDNAAVTKEEFDLYYDGKYKGYGIEFSDIWKLSNPINLDRMREIWPGFHPPQSYRYLANGCEIIAIY